MSPSLRVLFASALLLAGCPTADPPTDAGPGLDAPEGTDSGPREDAGPVDAPRDTGSDGGLEIACTGTDCGIVEVEAFGATTCVRRMNGDVICWGLGEDGQLGDGRMTHAPGCDVAGEPFPFDCTSGPVLVDLDEPALELEGENEEICAVVGAGREHWCWGEGNFNIGTVVAVRNYAPLEFPLLAGATASLGQSTWCYLDAAGDPFCIGNNGVGQLGDGTRDDRTMPVAVMIAPATAGDPPTALADETILEIENGTYSGTSCARTADTVYCWGANEAGQLGDGVETHFDCAGGAAISDCSLYAVPVMIDATMVEDLAIGQDHVCALMTDGTLQCWGLNIVGQLGLGAGDTATRTTPTPVPGITDAAAVVARGGNTCVLHDTGSVSCWGRSNLGQVGDGAMTHTSGLCGGATLVDCQPTPVAVMGIDDAVEISMSFSHACALRESGEVWCWGNNDRYQLGDGTRMTRFAPVRVPFLP